MQGVRSRAHVEEAEGRVAVNDSRATAAFARLKREADDGARVAERYAKLAADLREGMFTQQRDLIEDPSRFKAGLCGRRAGKSTCAIRYMLIKAIETPNANVQFITLSAKKARKEIFPDLKRTARRYDLQAEFNETTLTARFPNGAVINLDGVDDVSSIEKFRGSDGGYDLVVIDECKSFVTSTFDELVKEVLMPALADRQGVLVIIGTPGRQLSGPFYDVTNKLAPNIHESKGKRKATSRPYEERESSTWVGVSFQWSLHSWTAEQNVAKPHIWLDHLQTKERNGWSDDEPIWRREYCREWVADDSGYVYAYNPGRNDWEPDPESSNPYGLPDDHEWIYVEGSDLGFDDDFAIEVTAWSETTKEFYLGVYEVTMPGLDIPAIASEFEKAEAVFGEYHARTGDRGGLGKTIFATLAHQYGIDIEAAEKHEKRDYQELLNSELRAGRAKVRKGSKLARQMSMLQWKPDGKTEDKESSPKDACDASLYSWRYIYSAYSKPKERRPDPHSEEAIREQALAHRRRLSQEATRRGLKDSNDNQAESRDRDDEDGRDGDWHS